MCRHGGSDSWQFSFPPKGELESEGLERILPLLQNEKENEQKIRDLVMEMVKGMRVSRIKHLSTALMITES